MRVPIRRLLALPEQRIRLATLAADGHTGIPLVADRPEVSFDVTTSARTSAGRNVRLKLSKVVASVETTLGAEYTLPTAEALFEPNRVLHVRVAATGAAPTLLERHRAPAAARSAAAVPP